MIQHGNSKATVKAENIESTERTDVQTFSVAPTERNTACKSFHLIRLLFGKARTWRKEIFYKEATHTYAHICARVQRNADYARLSLYARRSRT